ncbi:GNAT family N-acetyltransferase [Streptomyces himalayensis]|uniref:GNAT family N-acetyltransferase n=1 Tax=Streptomyces himalayensis subsp. himalayensis TaxID=2756131 RepID=A0A7W0DS30_9ACTN|nr:GNAT family N-acetyltransferase [Streptomyces himalayensis]MBA2949419.1 GNAT family N-acetyltransferase [Streptomyces himalayensis subsp. himalayensis]
MTPLATGTVPPPPTPCLGGGWTLRPTDPVADLALVHGWFAASGRTRSREALLGELRGLQAGRAARPCIVSLHDEPVIYLEVHRVLHHPLRACYPVGAHDLALELVPGVPRSAGRQLIAHLLRDLTSALFASDPRCRRVTAAVDVEDAAAVGDFEAGGFRYVTDADLPHRSVALLVAEPSAVTTIATSLDAMPH